jgi:CBS domain-containing protein
MEPLEAILDAKGRDLFTTPPDASVLDAVETMCRLHIGALLVMSDTTLVGVFSERDLMTRVVLAGLDPGTTPVGDVMTQSVVTLDADSSVDEAMAIMTQKRVRHLPVVEEGHLLGLVSIGDLVRSTILDKEHFIEELQDYVSGRYPG